MSYALQRAINAAFHHRFKPSWDSAEGWLGIQTLLPAIPVTLRGTYAISRELKVTDRVTAIVDDPGVHGRAALGGAFVLRADAGPRDRLQPPADYQPFVPQVGDSSPTILGLPLWDGSLTDGAPALWSFIGSALLAVNAVGGVDIDGVAFDARFCAPSCLALYPRGPEATGSDHAGPRVGAIRNCSFTRARGALVQIGKATVELEPTPVAGRTAGPVVSSDDRPLPAETLAGLALPSDLDTSALRFDNCIFRPVEPDPDAGERATITQALRLGFAPVPGRTPPVSRPDRRVAIELRAGETAPVSLVDCLFDGDAAAMILAYSGTFALEACLFRNTRDPGTIHSVRPLDSELVRARRDNLPQGVDVFLGMPPRETSTTASGMVVQAIHRPMASFTAIHCDSTSYQFLATCKERQPGPSNGSVPQRPSILIGLRHTPPQVSRIADQEYYRARRPPSIVWGANGRLVLISCVIDQLEAFRFAAVENIGSFMASRRMQVANDYVAARFRTIQQEGEGVTTTGTSDPVREERVAVWRR